MYVCTVYMYMCMYYVSRQQQCESVELGKWERCEVERRWAEEREEWRERVEMVKEREKEREESIRQLQESLAILQEENMSERKYK